MSFESLLNDSEHIDEYDFSYFDRGGDGYTYDLSGLGGEGHLNFDSDTGSLEIWTNNGIWIIVGKGGDYLDLISPDSISENEKTRMYFDASVFGDLLKLIEGFEKIGKEKKTNNIDGNTKGNVDDDNRTEDKGIIESWEI